jgi:PHD/YefM family antitoxin component YafN of YafNO toxin-antitoxin module
MIITQNGEARAVLLDTESYQSLVNGIGLLKLLSHGEKEIEQAKVHDQKSVFAEMDQFISDLEAGTE